MSQRGIAGFTTIPLYCAFHKHANSKVEKRFSLPSIIIIITQETNVETQKHSKRIKIHQSQLDHKPWPVEPI